jgi:NAD+ diphosphatase
MLQDLALGRGSLDRMAEMRPDGAWLRRMVADPATFIVGVSAGDVAADGERLLDVRDRLEEASAFLLIGSVGRRVYVAATFPEPLAGFRSLREVGARLSADDAAVASAAVALHQWHRTHTHCPRCGAATVVAMGGWERHCPEDGTSHFPRTDPAVIVVITDVRDRLLLARQATWPERRFSLVAGYVEPGESAEQAVAREVLEEVGLVVGDLAFLGSQPWPFPASLMLCYRARAAGTDIQVDGVEIEEARWVSRQELPQLLASGDLLLPSAVSVARRAIEDWYGSALRD